MPIGWNWGEAGGGALAGAGTGAAIGTAFAPGIGTAIGAGAGLLGGALLGGIEQTPDQTNEAYYNLTSGAQEYQAETAWNEQQAAQQAAQAGLSPYSQAGGRSVEAQQALMGLLGPEAQQAAIAQLQAGPEFQAMMQQGEQAILQNAAATGGLRGGNTQAMLAQFRPQLLAQLINQQYGRLAGLTGTGLQAAGQSGNLGLSYSELGARTRGEIGAAIAGGEVAKAQQANFEASLAAQERGGLMSAGGSLLGAVFPTLLKTSGGGGTPAPE